jgi:predicted nuclease of restriction endonuclease-like (RecB) superfamily
VRNLKYMRAFAEAWPDSEIVHQLGAQIPWRHNCVLLDRVKEPETREFYIRKTVEHGWSRSVLMHQLDTKLHKRIGKAPSNFALTLPAPQSDLAGEILNDPYIFKPAPLDESANERALEQALLERLRDFLLELGAGFGFIGNQYRIEVNGDEFFLDLLFYHTRLHCYVVVDLKVVDFQPEFAGKMSFYQAAVDNQVKTPQDGATIGIILCRGKNQTVVEYTLRDAKSPIGVAEYRLLPPKLKAELPETKELKKLVAQTQPSSKPPRLEDRCAKFSWSAETSMTPVKLSKASLCFTTLQPSLRARWTKPRWHFAMLVTPGKQTASLVSCANVIRITSAGK